MSARLVAAVLLALPALAACSPEPEATTQTGYAGIVREPAPRVDRRALPNASGGGPAELRARPGGILLVYFGYTLCPDVCPTTMSDVRVALAGLPAAERRRVRVAMITVDPKRDTPAVLTRYVHAFFRDGLALRTTDQRLLRAAARSFGADYRVTRTKDGRVEVMHTAFTYAVDDTGHVRVQWAFGTRPPDYRRDVRRLLRERRA